MLTTMKNEATKAVKAAKRELRSLKSVNRHGGQGHNVADWERIASVAAGLGLMAFAIRKRGLTGGALAMAGAALLHRGATGECGIYNALGIDTARLHPVSPDDSGALERRKHEFDESPIKDVVEEASEESFPASDPPAKW